MIILKWLFTIVIAHGVNLWAQVPLADQTLIQEKIELEKNSRRLLIKIQNN